MPGSDLPGDDAAPAPDSAEAQKIEARLLWAERMESLAALTAGITHSLTNLLASTLMSVDLVLRTNPEGTHNQLLTSLQAMTRDSLEMVRQLMWIARGVEGRPIVFQAEYLFVEVQRLLQAAIPAVSVITDYPDDLWPLEGDPQLFVQLVLALCLETNRHLPAGAAILLSAANTEPASAAGTDRRIAIQAEVREQATSPSAGTPARAARTATAPAASTQPPGLWLVERPRPPAAALAVMAGGSFEVLQPPAGRGARIVLPAGDRVAKPAEPAGEPQRGDGASVVICEEAPILAQALTEVLAAHGYQAMIAPRSEPRPADAASLGSQDGQPQAGEPIAPPPRCPGDLLLVAASLDGEGTWQVCSAAAQATVPVILMVDAATADRLEHETPDRPRGFSPAAVLRKPFTARELLFALAASCRR